MRPQNHSDPVLIGVEQTHELFEASAVPKDVKASAVREYQTGGNVHMEHELCGIIALDLLLYPLELSSIPIKVLNILSAHEHRV